MNLKQRLFVVDIKPKNSTKSFIKEEAGKARSLSSNVSIISARAQEQTKIENLKLQIINK